MKIINYKRGYNSTFDCSIHGTLQVSCAEFKELIPLIKRTSLYGRFENDITKKYIVLKNGNHIYSFGVTPMQAIAKKYNLKNYKDCNYQIELINK